MARRRKSPQQKQESAPLFGDLSPHTKQAIGAIIFFVIGVFFVLSSLGLAGVAGTMTHSALTYLFGYGFVLAPVVSLLFVYVFMRPREDNHVSGSKILGIILTFIALLGLLALTVTDAGGVVGGLTLYPLLSFFGGVVSGITLGALILVGLFLTFNTSFTQLFARKESTDDDLERALPPVDTNIDVPPLTPEEIKESGGNVQDEHGVEKPKKQSVAERVGLAKVGSADFAVSSFMGPYAPPSLSLLNKDKGRPEGGDLKSNMVKIKRTLKNFNIEVEIDTVTPGPTFTRYALKPAEGVKLERITALQSNLELALEASPIRIEAPIPGKSLVGIEVPNTERQTIGIATLFNYPQYTDSPKPLLTVLGKDISGNPEFADIARMPHALIAGTTGSGKSVAIHNIIISLLYRNSPDQLRFIMVDPKLVELSLYNGIPHLLTPVITEPKKVIMALKWALNEMERRYQTLLEHKVQNIDTYHEKVYESAKRAYEKSELPLQERDPLPESLPYIVIIIDELADLMSLYPKEIEACIVRLAQKSRAIGIHLILATQRPEVRVITGLIKANLPTRIALNVKSLIDSRTILDQAGAEKLLGKGDMLFLSSESPKPKRLQSAFVTVDEVKRVVHYLKDQDAAQSLDTIDLESAGKQSGSSSFDIGNDDDEDELYEDARLAVIEAGKASTSLLQRRLRIGYGRAARLMDILEERGVIGPSDGTNKPRPILEGAPPEEPV